MPQTHKSNSEQIVHICMKQNIWTIFYDRVLRMNFRKTLCWYDWRTKSSSIRRQKFQVAWKSPRHAKLTRAVDQCFPKPKTTSSHVWFCPQPGDPTQKTFTFKKLESENRSKSWHSTALVRNKHRDLFNTLQNFKLQAPVLMPWKCSLVVKRHFKKN